MVDPPLCAFLRSVNVSPQRSPVWHGRPTTAICTADARCSVGNTGGCSPPLQRWRHSSRRVYNMSRRRMSRAAAGAAAPWYLPPQRISSALSNWRGKNAELLKLVGTSCSSPQRRLLCRRAAARAQWFRTQCPNPGSQIRSFSTCSGCLVSYTAWRSPEWSTKVRANPCNCVQENPKPNQESKRKKNSAAVLTGPVSYEGLTNEPFAHWKAAAYWSYSKAWGCTHEFCCHIAWWPLLNQIAQDKVLQWPGTP